jgi:hypothetical protein
MSSQPNNSSTQSPVEMFLSSSSSSPSSAEALVYSSSSSQHASSGPPPLYWSWGETLISIPLAFIVIGTIFGNFFVLYAFFTRPRTLRSATHFFIANLAFADFLVGLLVMPYLATLQLTKIWYFGQTYCMFWTVTHFWLCSASILSTCAVCIERYIGVKYPLHHREIMSPQRIGGLIAGVWILAGFLSLSSLFIWPEPYDGDEYKCRINQQIGHVIVAVVGILYIPAAVMIILYWRIYSIATSHLNLMKKKSFGSGSVPLDTVSSSSSGANTNFDYKKVKGDGKKNGGILEGGRIQPIIDHESSSGVSFSNISDVEGSNGSVPISSEGKQSITKSSRSDTSEAGRNPYTKKQIDLARRLSLLVGILLASYIPFFTVYLVRAFHPGSIHDTVFSTFGWIRYFNSCVNPLIYAFAVPAYRKALSSIIFMGKCCP